MNQHPTTKNTSESTQQQNKCDMGAGERAEGIVGETKSRGGVRKELNERRERGFFVA
jgi:hypothetical protein